MAPVGSVTVPVRAPVPADWARSDAENAIKRAGTSQQDDSFLDVM
jgi:hypothetical protein